MNYRAGQQHTKTERGKMEMEEFAKNRSPLEYTKVFFRRKWYFIVPTLAGLVLGITACFILQPAYESSTMILVEEEKIINPLIENLAISTTAALMAATSTWAGTIWPATRKRNC